RDEDGPEPGWLGVDVPLNPALVEELGELGLESLDVVGHLVESTLAGGAAHQASTCLLGVLAEDHQLVSAFLHVLDELGDLDLLRPGYLGHPVLREDGYEDDCHPVDDEGANGAIQRSPRGFNPAIYHGSPPYQTPPPIRGAPPSLLHTEDSCICLRSRARSRRRTPARC